MCYNISNAEEHFCLCAYSLTVEGDFSRKYFAFEKLGLKHLFAYTQGESFQRFFIFFYHSIDSIWIAKELLL